MAGWTTYGKLDKFCLLPIQSIGLAVTTFVGQNLGADNMKRARKGNHGCIIHLHCNSPDPDGTCDHFCPIPCFSVHQ